MKREQWILINEISTSVINLNSIFCEGNTSINEEYSQEDINDIAKGIAQKCSKMQLEDAIDVLSDALKINS